MTENRFASALQTLHGELKLPAFLPDATRAVVRTLDSEDLRRCRIQGVVVNALHLASHPGSNIVAAAGGIHEFMGWDAPVLSDSGGFQIYSLLAESPGMGSITKKGFYYRLEKDQRKKLLTPEKCIQRQVRMGSDIMVSLDQCTHPSSPHDQQRTSVENTVGWARRCREEFDRLTADKDERGLLFAVIQGGGDPALRKQCAEQLLEIGFDGYGFGGWPIDDDGQLVEMVHFVAELVPDGVAKWALGIGKPEHVVKGVRLGYGVFDCVLPTRDARHGRLYVFRSRPDQSSLVGKDFYEHLYIRDDKHRRDGGPVDEYCDCLCCRNYSRGYLHHLFRVGDALGSRLATMHNLRFYTRLMEQLRAGSTSP